PMGGSVADPDAVLLVNCKAERGEQMAWVFERLARLVHKQIFGLFGIALGQMNDLGIVNVERPDVTIRRGDNPLHLAEPATKGPAIGRRERLAILVELDDGLAAISRGPAIVLRVNAQSKADAFDPAAGKARSFRRERLAIR